jgi:uncharacterized membrane protein
MKRIFATRCVPCHAPGGALPNWTDYSVALAKKERIRERVINQKNMPPPANNKLTDEERVLIGKWLDAGAPQGDDQGSEPQPSPKPAPAPGSVEPDSMIALIYDAPNGMKPWLAKNCSVCHDGSNPDMGTPNWQEYDQVMAKKDAIYKRVINDRDMPPGGVTGEGVELSEQARATLKAWLEKGAPR